MLDLTPQQEWAFFIGTLSTAEALVLALTVFGWVTKDSKKRGHLVLICGSVYTVVLTTVLVFVKTLTLST